MLAIKIKWTKYFLSHPLGTAVFKPLQPTLHRLHYPTFLPFPSRFLPRVLTVSCKYFIFCFARILGRFRSNSRTVGRGSIVWTRPDPTHLCTTFSFTVSCRILQRVHQMTFHLRCQQHRFTSHSLTIAQTTRP